MNGVTGMKENRNEKNKPAGKALKAMAFIFAVSAVLAYTANLPETSAYFTNSASSQTYTVVFNK